MSTKVRTSKFVKHKIQFTPQCTFAHFHFYTHTSDDYDLEDKRYDERHTHTEIINKTTFNDDNFIHSRMSSRSSLLRNDASLDLAYNPSDANEVHSYTPVQRTYPMMLELIRESLSHSTQAAAVTIGENTITNQLESEYANSLSVPTLGTILHDAESKDGTKLDNQQKLTYHSICATFLLGLINDGKDNTTSLGQYFTAITGHDNPDPPTTTNYHEEQIIKTKLMSIGGREQLVMFLTGPAGAGKTTAVKLAQTFCFNFCKAVSMIWRDNTFLFTAYTGSAACAFGGITTCSAAFLNKKRELSDDEKGTWEGVRIVVIDEISFMKALEVEKLNKNLQLIGDSNKPFGGYSVIFAGDFRQLEPPGAKDSDLLFSRQSGGAWENKLNAVIFLENKHRFKKDPRYGEMLKKMWEGDLSKEDRQWINERYVGRGGAGLRLPKSHEFEDVDVVYAAPFNKERNAITAGNFRDHVQKNCPSIDSDDLPPHHTIIIEADIISAERNSKNKPITGSLRHRIHTTCGDSNCNVGTKHVDPTLCLYTGSHLICTIGNEKLRDKVPIGNGTTCRLVGMKLKDGISLHRWKNYYDKKVWTVSASEVEWIECERYPRSQNVRELEAQIKQHENELKQQQQSQMRQAQVRKELRILQGKLIHETKKHTFRLKTKTERVKVNVKPHAMSTVSIDLKCKMTQFPVNCNDATTGHKLQGMSKDVVIVTSWPSTSLFKNWEYVVLSRVRTHDGLYLFQKLPMDKDFSPSEELSLFFKRARAKEHAFNRENKQYAAKLQQLIFTMTECDGNDEV